jgi:lipopolysaccharide biosynthesis glycosyltransferase
MVNKIYVGWDAREDIAYQVCRHSIVTRTNSPDYHIMPLKLNELRNNKLIWRANDPKASTEFTFTRFLIPFLNNYRGWALFCDCDFLFLSDIKELFELADPTKAVMVVQHDYTPSESVKMDNKPQEMYPRKNWSSLILYNCEHPSNQQVNLNFINTQSMSFMHRFGWLNDKEIGSLPYQWNYLEGWYNSNDAKAVHYTRGGPWFKDWQTVDYAAEWIQEKKKLNGIL